MLPDHPTPPHRLLRRLATTAACLLLAFVGLTTSADAQPADDTDRADPPNRPVQNDRGDRPTGPRDADRPGRRDRPATRPRGPRSSPGDAAPDADGRPDRPPHPDRPARTGRLSDEYLQDAGETLAIIRPALAERFEKLRESDPREAAALLNEHFPQVHALIRLKRSDAVMFDLRTREIKAAHEAVRLAMLHARAEREPVKQRLAGELRDALKNTLEVRREIRQHELELLEARLAEMRERIAEEQKNRDSILMQKFERITQWAARKAEQSSDTD